MTTDMIITLTILAITAVLFMIGKIRSDLIAVSSMVLLVVFDILTPNEALSGFSNSVVIMMIGLFVVGGGIFQTGLAKMVSSKILQVSGKSELKLLVTIILVTAVVGFFVSNTGTVAVMLPIVVSLAMNADMNASRLLMPLAFASSISGLMTLIGTPANLVVSEVLETAGYGKLGFFSVTPVGTIALVTGTLLMIPLSKLLVKEDRERGGMKHNTKRRSLKELARQYQIAQNLYRLQALEDSPILRKPLANLNIPGRYQVSVVEIRRKTSQKSPFFKTINQEVAGPATWIQSGDILYVFGAFEQVERFAAACGLQLLDTQATEKLDEGRIRDMLFHEIGIAEVLLTPDSKLIDKQVKHSNFREKFNVNILGIRRGSSYILQNLKDERIRFGDALLVQGTWDNLDKLSQEQEHVVVVGQPLQEAAKVTLDHKAPIAAGILLLMVVMMVFDLLPSVIAVLIAAILMIVTGCLRSMEAAYNSVNWESIVLIGGMIPMSLAIEKTGAAALLSEGLVQGLGQYGPLALLAGLYFAASIVTLFISNTATAVLFTPIALSAAVQIGVSPYPFMIAVAAASSFCFASPFSTPPNALVMSAGRYTFSDYLKVGLPLQILLGVVMLLVMPLIYPF